MEFCGRQAVWRDGAAGSTRAALDGGTITEAFRVTQNNSAGIFGQCACCIAGTIVNNNYLSVRKLRTRHSNNAGNRLRFVLCRDNY